MIFKIVRFLWYLPRNVVIFFIKGYQGVFSHDHGLGDSNKNNFPFGYCRYTPTCSEYGIEAIKKYGLLYGGLKALWRVLRCNPWSKGGYDKP